MLERHLQYTGSPIARRILDDWHDAVARFVRVMPRDYARVLRQQEQARQETVHAS